MRGYRLWGDLHALVYIIPVLAGADYLWSNVFKQVSEQKWLLFFGERDGLGD